MAPLLARLRLASTGAGVSNTSTTRSSLMLPAFPPVSRKWFRPSTSQDHASHASDVQSLDHNGSYGNILHDHLSQERYPFGIDGITHRLPPIIKEVGARKSFENPGRIRRTNVQEGIVTSLETSQFKLQEELKKKSELRTALPLYHVGRETKFERVPYWQSIARWKDVPESLWLDYSWGTAKNIQGKQKLYQFLTEVLPESIPASENFPRISTRDEFIQDVMEGIDAAPMSIRLTPHILSSIDWNDPLDDPLRRQFIPMKTSLQPDHPMLEMDSLHETEDSPVEGLVHRYTDKCLFLATSVCPLYCRYCTRSYAVGANTDTVTKASLKPKKARWEDMFNYIRNTPAIHDVVISGGDSYLLTPPQVRLIGRTLLEIPHVRRIRFASKGLCVSPSRTLDPHDDWTNALIEVVKLGRTLGKPVALHTHFNHANEFSWVSREAAQRLCSEGVVVRNQSVLLRGVNDSVEAMEKLLRELADCNIIPYYVYQHDLVAGIEDLRTPLSTILSLERSLRGSIAGFMTPQFVVDLPGGGGKRLAASFESYDRETGKSTFTAPAVKGGNAVYEYWDPVASLGEKGREIVGKLRK